MILNIELIQKNLPIKPSGAAANHEVHHGLYKCSPEQDLINILSFSDIIGKFPKSNDPCAKFQPSI